MAERIIVALDNADGVTDGQVLGLTLPSMAAGEVVNGAIVLGGTEPKHDLITRAPFGVNVTHAAVGGRDRRPHQPTRSMPRSTRRPCGPGVSAAAC